jgi:hypothetical protein
MESKENTIKKTEAIASDIFTNPVLLFLFMAAYLQRQRTWN